MEQIGLVATIDGVRSFLGDLDKMNGAVESFAQTGATSGATFDHGFGEIVTGALRHIGTLAVDALADAARATAGFLKDSIGLAGDFQSGMLEFQAVAGRDVDAKGLHQFHDLFVQLGKDLPVSTSDVQQAAIEMVKGGIDPATIAAGGLRQNIQFAAAAMKGDLAGAAEISAKILGGWADANATAAQKSEFLTHSTDLLTKAANASSVDVHELSLGIFNAQGIAKTAGVSFDDLTTTLAEIAPRFASSSEAGNSLKNVIARLQPTTQPAIDAFKALNLITADGSNVFYDAQGNFVGFQQASQLLQDSLQGLTKQQQQQVLQTMFGNDAMNSAAALAELGSAGYQKMADSLASANGVQENAALKQQGFNTALENAKGSVEALQITLGEKLLPVLTSVLNDYIAPAINTLTTFAGAVFGDNDAFNALSPTLQAIVTVIDAVAQGFGEDGLLGAANQLIPGLGSVGGAASDLSGIWNQAIDVIADVGKGYEDIIDSVLPIVSGFVDDHGAEIEGFFKGAYDQIIVIIKTALALYDAIVPPILHAIAGFIDAHGKEISAIFDGVWKIISGIVDAALTLITGVLKVALALIKGDWQGAWTAIQEMSARIVQDIIRVIAGAAEGLGAAAQLGLDAILGVWHSFTDWAGIGGSIIDGIVSGVVDGAKHLARAAADAAESALSAAKSALGISSPSKAFAEVGSDSMAGWEGGMQRRAPDLLSTVEDFASSLIGQARSSLGGIGAPPLTHALASPLQLGAAASMSTRTVNLYVDARGSSLTMADIQRGVQAGLRAEGDMADMRIRAGVA